MLISPAMWRRVFKPRIRGMFEAFKGAKPDVKLAWHSCGSIVPIIPDFIEVGLDILNPIQPRARGMEPRFLKREYGRDLCFFGGLDIQELLPRGTPAQVRDEVRRLVEILGADGGYILAPAHNVQDDTPTENILAVFEAVKEAD
jgi:uroporphyrinogen decarboxylase